MNEWNDTATGGSDRLRLDARAGTIDAADSINILKRRKCIVISSVCLSLFASIVYLCFATPTYISDVKIIVEGNSGPLVALGKGDIPPLQKETDIDDAVEILRSRTLANRVITQLDLATDPTFQLRASIVSRWISRIANQVRPAKPNAEVSPELRKKIVLDTVTQAFLNRLSVERLNHSNVVSVSFSSQSPETAWKVAHAIGEVYFAWRTEDKSERAQKANAWLDERTRELSKKVRQADEAAEEYRSSHGLLEGERVSLLTEQISKVGSSLIDASGERKKTESELAQVKRLTAKGSDISSAQQILDSALYVRLREQQLEIERDYAQQAQELGPRHPYILQLQAKRARAQEDIKAEIAKVARALESQAAAARQREDSLAAELSNLKQELAQANIRSVELRALEQEAAANREMLQRMVADAMAKDAERSPGAQSPQARVISEATFPTTPVTPKKSLLLVLATAGSALLGILVAFLAELLDKTYRSSAQIEQDLGIPVLAYLSKLPKLPWRRSAPALSIATAPFSAATEAIRAIRVRLAALEPAPKVVAVVSSEPKEGKSTLALAVAALEARAGRRVLLLDADVRRSGVARALGLAVGSGLADVILEVVPMSAAIHRSTQIGVDVIVARGTTLYDLDADALTVHPDRFRKVVTALRTDYDLIVIDAPSASVLADAQVAAATADVAVMVVAWGRTSKKSVQTALHTLRASGARIAGVLFNRVNNSNIVTYTEGEAGYCNRRYQRHYTPPGG